MARGTPSMIALLGLLAVAGYQNRDKLGAMMKNAGLGGTGPDGRPLPGGDLGSLFGGAGGGGSLAEGLRSLIDRFKEAGQGDVADSWVGKGDNRDLAPESLSAALDDETLAELERKTGMTRDELIRRLTGTLPEAVNSMTPEGRLPTDEEAQRFV